MSSTDTSVTTIPGLPKQRLETLIDGIFCVTMLLLILQIRLPVVNQLEDLPQALLDLWPRYLLSYVGTFLMCAVYWINHHNQFHFIQRIDRVFVWINLLFLMHIACLPYSSALLGMHRKEQSVVLLYGVHLAVLWLILYVNWWYATNNRRLVAADLDAAVVGFSRERILMGLALSLLGVILSFFNTAGAILIYLAFPFIYAFPGKVDRFWKPVHPKVEL
ncbi:MAG: TMEM175 family protein [Pseudomonadota bacterium]